MRKSNRSLLGAALAVATLATAGCDSFLEVENPGVIESSTIDPLQDAETFSRSAATDFYNAFDDLAVYGAAFTGEIWVDDTFQGRNDIPKRQVDYRDNTLRDDVYLPIARAVARNQRVLDLLAGTPAENSISTARASLNLGYSLVMMAETFCQGVISRGAEEFGQPMTPAQTMDRAIESFQKAIQLATPLTGAEAQEIINAARVGTARAYLQKGGQANWQAAIQAAQPVPEEFVYNALKVDDPSSRVRLGNTQYYFTVLRPNLVVPPYYRALNDPRVPFQLGTATGQGGELLLHIQTKFDTWAKPVRVASGLEARYIIAEAEFKLGNPAPAVALIASRAAAGSGVDGDDFASGNEVLIELMDQRSRDFYLEGKHMGDWQRNPQETPYVLPVGTPYYVTKIGGAIGPQQCLPVHALEVDNNPNFPKP